MAKIKFIVDSPSDIPKELVVKHDIKVIPTTIIMEDRSLLDYYDFTPQEFYSIFKKSPNVPTTAHATPNTFLNAYKEALENGYEEIVVVTINSLASGFYQSALIAKSLLREEMGDSSPRVEIIDSHLYTMLYGAVVVIMAEMSESGKNINELLAYANYHCPRIEAYAMFDTLEYIKRTGRISSIAGFVGEILDVKPIIHIGDSAVNAYGKIRGRKNIVPKLFSMMKEKISPDSEFIIIILGEEDAEIEHEMYQCVSSEYSNKRIITARIGGALCINTGPNVFGFGFLGNAVK